MDSGSQLHIGRWRRDEKLALYSLLIALLGFFATVGAMLVQSAPQAPSVSSMPPQVNEASAQSYLLVKSHETAAELKLQLERANADKAAAEQRAKEAEERAAVWQVASVENNTQCEIRYEVLNGNGGWETISVKPNERWSHWRKNSEVRVKYSYCLNGRSQEREYSLTASTVVGHEPTEMERSAVPVNYFDWNNRSELMMYLK